MSEEKVGIKDSKEVIDFLVAYVEELKGHKDDDGVIDASEALAALSETSGKAVAAIMGSWNMPEELRDLDADEKDELLSASMLLVKSMAELLLDADIGE